VANSLRAPMAAADTSWVPWVVKIAQFAENSCANAEENIAHPMRFPRETRTGYGR
jgi:hypothetical protein